MVRIGPGTGLSGPNAGKEEKATASESDDAAEDPPDNSGSNSEPTRTSAATGTLAALSHEEAGAEDVQNKNVGVVGSSVDALQDPETGDVAYASDSQSWQGDGRMAEVNVATPEGGVDVSVSPDGEVDPGRQGDTSRMTEVQENYRDASTSDDSQPDPTQQPDQTRDQTNDSGPTTNTETEQQAQQRFSSSGQGFGSSGGLGFPGDNGSGSGDLMDKLTSPAGIVLLIIATVAVVFGGSEAIEEEGN